MGVKRRISLEERIPNSVCKYSTLKHVENDSLNILQKHLFNILQLLINQLVFMYCM